MRGVVEVVSGYLWLAIVGLTIYLFVFWLKMFNHIAPGRSRLFANLIPIFLFDASFLTEKGQLIRKRFLKIVLVVIVLMAILCGIIFSGLKGLDESMFQR